MDTTNGIINKENTCYLGASLQFLATCAALCENITQSPPTHREKTIHDNNVMRELRSILQEMSYRDPRHRWRKVDVDPSGLLQAMTCNSKTNRDEKFDYWTQNDAQEFLTILLEFVGDNILNNAGWWKMSTLNTIYCLVCNQGSKVMQQGGQEERQQVHGVLCLPIRSATNVQEALDAYLESDVSDYRCPHCGDQVSNKKKSETIISAPRVLLVSLNRFENGSKDVREIVMSRSLFIREYEVEVDGLGVERDIEYRLVSAVFHIGSNTTSGHYVCARRELNPSLGNGPGTWKMFDDCRVFQVPCPWDKVSKEVYMLAYEKYLNQ